MNVNSYSLYLFLAVLSMTKTSAAAERPNFLFIYSDDQRWDALGCVQREMGETGRFPELKTPNLDRLATEGARFRKAFVVSSLCSPSRASFVTGCYGHSNGVVDNYTPLPLDSVTYATELVKAGYRTGYFGKWHMQKQIERPGFEEVASYTGQGVYYDGSFIVNGIVTPTKGYVDDVTTDYAMNFIRQFRTEPFALAVGFKAVHSPRTPMGKHLEDCSELVFRPAVNAGELAPYLEKGKAVNDKLNDDRRNYFRCLNGIDDCVGRMLALLDELGLSKNTVVIFTSDNGYYMGEHGLKDKRTAYDESMLIPFLVRWPGVIAPGRIIDQMILNIDLAPTLLDAAGVEIPSSMQGRSWRPLLNGSAPENWRTSFFYEYYVDSEYPWVPKTLAVRTENAKMIRYPGHEEWTELYDLQADTHEKKNLWNDPESKPLKDRMEAEFAKESARLAYPKKSDVSKTPLSGDEILQFGERLDSLTNAAFIRQVGANEVICWDGSDSRGNTKTQNGTLKNGSTNGMLSFSYYDLTLSTRNIASSNPVRTNTVSKSGSGSLGINQHGSVETKFTASDATAWTFDFNRDVTLRNISLLGFNGADQVLLQIEGESDYLISLADTESAGWSTYQNHRTYRFDPPVPIPAGRNVAISAKSGEWLLNGIAVSTWK